MRRSGWTVEVRRPTFGSVMGVALVTLIALKLAGVIDWSWWWVLVPLWLQVPGIAILVLLVTYSATNVAVTKLADWWRWRRLERRPDW